MDKAIMLDRDGTLVNDSMYPHKIKDFRLLPGVIQGLKKLSKDYIFVIVTNQSGIGRGIFSEEDMHKFNGKLINELKNNNIEIKKIYFCPHIPEDNCDCRKPATKNILQAKKDLNIDMENSWVIGDHPSDVELGKNAGTRTVYLKTGHGIKHFEDLEKNEIKPDFVAENFLHAAEFITDNMGTH
jgi:D-glycero-D-manno-heptose 1,7-bisphosphate phosphatase